MFTVKQNTALDLPFFAFDANGNAVTGLLTGDWTKRISKGSGAFAAMTVTITEMEYGIYYAALTASHTDTLGILTITFQHASCKQVNLQFRIEARLADNLAFPTTSGRSLDVNADGTVDPNFDNATGTLTKGTDLLGFNDLSSTVLAAHLVLFAASSALTAYDPPTKAEMDTAVAAQGASLALTAYDVPTNTDLETALGVTYAASLALAAYDGPTHTEMTAELAALNDITVAEVLAATVDGTLDVEDALKGLLAYVRGRIVKTSTAFAYYSQTSTLLFTNNITSADRNKL